MRVIVLKDDGTFYKTAAFAIHYDGWKTEFFVINDKREFERIYEYTQDKSKVEKRVFILDADINQDDFVETDDYEGYKSFVNNKKLLDRIRKGEKNIFTPDEMIGFESYIFSENFDIIVEDEKTCHILSNFAGFFHDAVVKDYSYDEKKKNLIINLDGVWGLENLKLIFEDVSKYNIEEDYEYNYFSCASLFMEDDEVCFVNDECDKKEEINEGWTFVYAKRLKFEYTFEKPE